MKEANPPTPFAASLTTGPIGVCNPSLTPISVQAGVVSEALGVTSAADLVVGLIEVSSRDHEIAFPIAFKPGSGHDIEDSIGAVSVVGIIAASLYFEIINVLGIDLRPEIVGDVCIGDGDAVDQPVDLMAAAHVQHVVGDVSCGHIIGDHLHAIGAIRSGSLLDVDAVHCRGGRDGVGGCLHWSFRNEDSFLAPAIVSSSAAPGWIRSNNYVSVHFLEAL